MATVDLATGGTPLTVLSEDEQMFRDLVRGFAEESVRPLVHEMDEHQKMSPDLIPQFFEMGLMGIEVPEEHGGTGASFFTAALVVEELSRVDASVGVFVDVQNTLVNNAFLRWGARRSRPSTSRRSAPRRWAPTPSPRPAPGRMHSRSPPRR
jgi:alkylation response protein AidB-like acyl-CoA dehydrogenase